MAKKQAFSKKIVYFTSIMIAAALSSAACVIARDGVIDALTAFVVSLAAGVVAIYGVTLVDGRYGSARALVLHSIAYSISMVAVLGQAAYLLGKGVEEPILVLADGVTHLSGEWFGVLFAIPLCWSLILGAHAVWVISQNSNSIDKL